MSILEVAPLKVNERGQPRPEPGPCQCPESDTVARGRGFAGHPGALQGRPTRAAQDRFGSARTRPSSIGRIGAVIAAAATRGVLPLVEDERAWVVRDIVEGEGVVVSRRGACGPEGAKEEVVGREARVRTRRVRVQESARHGDEVITVEGARYAGTQDAGRGSVAAIAGSRAQRTSRPEGAILELFGHAVRVESADAADDLKPRRIERRGLVPSRARTCPSRSYRSRTGRIWSLRGPTKGWTDPRWRRGRRSG